MCDYMELDLSKRNEIVQLLYENFEKYNVFKEEYIHNFISAILAGKKMYAHMVIDVSDIKETEDISTYLLRKLTNYFYGILCRLAISNQAILTYLLEENYDLVREITQIMQVDEEHVVTYMKFYFCYYDGQMEFKQFLRYYVTNRVKGIDIQFPSVVVDAKKKKTKEKIYVEEVKNNPYLACMELVQGRVGTGEIDSFIQLGNQINIIQYVETNGVVNKERYLLLRFGYINHSFFTREEIAQILGIDIVEVIDYERELIDVMQQLLTSQMEHYGMNLLSKRFIKE